MNNTIELHGRSGNVANLKGSFIPAGPRGYSAYEVWLHEGHEGTVEDFLNSLKGTKEYPELNNKPSINGVILDGNKTLAELGIDNDYPKLNNKPSINGVILEGNKTSEELGIENYDDTDIRNRIDNINSDLGNVQDNVQSLNNKVDNKQDTLIPGANITIVDNVISSTGGTGGVGRYSELPDKPSVNGVTLEGNKTSNDLGVVDIDDALTEQEVQNMIEQYGGEPIDLNDYAKKEELPTKLSQLENDSNYINNIKTINNQSLIGTGNINIEGGSGGTNQFIEINDTSTFTFNDFEDGKLYIFRQDYSVTGRDYEGENVFVSIPKGSIVLCKDSTIRTEQYTILVYSYKTITCYLYNVRENLYYKESYMTYSNTQMLIEDYVDNLDAREVSY